MYRFWHGPVVGLSVSHVWSSFAPCLFLDFGSLTPGGTFTDLKGNVRQHQPHGEWELTSMDAWPAWWLRQNGRVIASWVDCRRARRHALRLLIGRCLNALEIDPSSKSTRLRFSLGLELETKTDPALRKKAHWLMCRSDQRKGDWPSVVLQPWRDSDYSR